MNTAVPHLLKETGARAAGQPQWLRNPFPGLLMVLLIITAATHAALLDNDKIGIGK